MTDATGPILFAPVDVAVGETEVVAAVQDKRIRVLGLCFTAVGTGLATVTLQSDAAPGATALTGAMDVDTSIVWPVGGLGWTQTLVGESLTLLVTLLGVTGCLVYQQVA